MTSKKNKYSILLVQHTCMELGARQVAGAGKRPAFRFYGGGGTIHPPAAAAATSGKREGGIGAPFPP
jgi:hypothetical protein